MMRRPTPTSCRDVVSFPKAKVQTVTRLHLDHLCSLNAGDVGAVLMKNSMDQPTCKETAHCLLERQRQDYSNAPGVGRFPDSGTPYFEARQSASQLAAYHRQAPKVKAAMEGILGWSPGQRILDILQPVHPKGAAPLSIDGRPMFHGMCRVFSEGGSALPHEDKLERDDPSVDLDKLGYRGQLALNCYVQVPEKGAELKLYGISMTTAEYDRLRGESYGISESLLPPPLVTYKPCAGDLVLFNARYLHAVSPVPSGQVPRVTMSCFICYGGDEMPLRLWS